MPEVRKSLKLTKEEVWTSNICSVAGCIVMRVINGSFCDKYGARILMGVLLMLASIPCALTGLVQNSGESIVICCVCIWQIHMILKCSFSRCISLQSNSASFVSSLVSQALHLSAVNIGLPVW